MSHGIGKSRVITIRGWEDDLERDFTIEELVAKNDTRGKHFSYDVSSYGGDGESGLHIDLVGSIFEDKI